MKSIECKVLSIRGFVVLVSLIFIAGACNRQVQKPTATINNHVINLEIARTPAERAQGLSNRVSLAEDNGMLFIFEIPGKYGFWMKDMKFPLDFIWINDSKVVEITANVPNTGLHTYTPSQDIDSIIEVNAGWANKNEVKVGDTVLLTE